MKIPDSLAFPSQHDFDLYSSVPLFVGHDAVHPDVCVVLGTRAQPTNVVS